MSATSTPPPVRTAFASGLPTPGTATGTPAGGTPPSTFPMLTAPLMGDVFENGTANAAAWTGGKPKADWTGLEDPARGMFSPNCIRNAKTGEKVKTYNFRIAAPLQKFAVGDDTFDIAAYTKVVLDHMNDTGMDTVMHIASQMDATTMVNIIKNNEQVTLSHVEDQSKLNYVHFDAYDKENDKAAKLFLERSIQANLYQELSLRQLDDDSAATTWMRILYLVSDGSVERYNRQKEELKALSPLKEPGENIMLFSSKVFKICKALEQAKQFEWMLILFVVKALSTCTVESFRSMWFPKRLALDGDLQQASFLAPQLVTAFMLSKGHHYTQILGLADKAYKSLLDNGDWHPATTVKDTQQAPGLFFAGMDQAQFNALVQSEVQKTISSRPQQKPSDGQLTCYNCKETGHKRKDCPKSSSGTGETPTTWRALAPKPGEPSTCTKNGKVFNFCTKCKYGKGFWTATHTTETHGAQVPATAPSPAVVQANLAAADEGPLNMYQF